MEQCSSLEISGMEEEITWGDIIVVHEIMFGLEKMDGNGLFSVSLKASEASSNEVKK